MQKKKQTTKYLLPVTCCVCYGSGRFFGVGHNIYA